MKTHITALVVFMLGMLLSLGEGLTEQDKKELIALQQNITDCTLKGNFSQYPKCIERRSLIALMMEHRSMLNTQLRRIGQEQLEEYIKFDPDLETVLQERDPEKYFMSISPKPDYSKLLSKQMDQAGIKCEVVAIASQMEQVTNEPGEARAYIVTLGKVDGELGSTAPYYAVWPAVKTKNGWKLDVSSTLVRQLRISNEKYR